MHKLLSQSKGLTVLGDFSFSFFPFYPRLAWFSLFSHFMKFSFFWGEKICKMNLRNFLSCLFFVVDFFHKHRSCTHYRFLQTTLITMCTSCLTNKQAREQNAKEKEKNKFRDFAQSLGERRRCC